MDRRTIPCDKDTRDKLRGLKTDGQTYDELLQELINHYES